MTVLGQENLRTRNATLATITLGAALIIGLSYLITDWVEIDPLFDVAWKGAGVWLLALYAGLRARNNDGWIIAFVMALGAMGDVLVERSLFAGSLAFIIGHIAAIYLYLNNRRVALTPSQQRLAVLLVPAIMIIAWSLTRDATVLLYSLFLSMMAASAWISRFPRYRTGIGAVLFVASDLLIFAQMGPLAETEFVSPLIWLLYFVGQVLIVLGVTNTLSKKKSRRVA
jgi:uncharacterized membrane protein YhhN